MKWLAAAALAVLAGSAVAYPWNARAETEGLSPGFGTSNGISQKTLPVGTIPTPPTCTGAINLTTTCVQPMLGGM